MLVGMLSTIEFERVVKFLFTLSEEIEKALSDDTFAFFVVSSRNVTRVPAPAGWIPSCFSVSSVSSYLKKTSYAHVVRILKMMLQCSDIPGTCIDLL